MTAAAVFNRVDDALNPIVVKELRQSIHSRFVTIVLSLFLVVAVLVIGGVLLSSTNERLDPHAGAGVFLLLHGVVLATCLLFVPLYTGVRLAGERSDTNVDLLFITTIKPRSIVWGKFWSGVLIAGLIYSACLPFMTLTYLLRGIDLLTVSIIVAADAGVIMAAIMLAIAIACMGLNRIIKILVGLAAAAGMTGVFSGMIAMSEGMLRFGAGSLMMTRDFWLAVAITTALAVVLIALLAMIATAMIKPPSANRALPIRVFLTAVWLVGYIVAFCVSAYYPYAMNIPVWIWTVICFSVLMICLMSSIAERDDWGVRVRQKIPRAPLGRGFAFLFYSGSAGGLLWTVALASLTLGAVPLSYPLFGRIPITASYVPPMRLEMTQWNLSLLVVAMYLLAYALTAVLVRWYLLRRWLKPIGTPALAIMLMVLGVLGPVLFAFFIGDDPFAYGHRLEYPMLGNPAAILFRIGPGFDDYFDMAALFSGLWALAVAIFAMPWALRQMRLFRPLEAGATLPL